MSHFTVLVIGDDVEAKLAPYQENNMGDCPQEYLEFNDVTDEEKKYYEEKIVDEEFKKECPTFDIYMNKYCGYEFHKDQKAYWYWHNPNSQWDWYQISWRWGWSFLLKKWVDKSQYPEIDFSWGWSEEEKEKVRKWNYTDQAKVKDIDWDKMKQKEYDRHYKIYNDIVTACWWWIPNPAYTFEECEKMKSVLNEEWKVDYDKVREKYNTQKEIVYYREQTRDIDWASRSPFDYLWFKSVEDFAEKKSNNFFVTYAVITEDWKWHAKWEMGWFGCSSETPDEAQKFNDNYFDTFIKDLDPETLITVVDCHI